MERTNVGNGPLSIGVGESIWVANSRGSGVTKLDPGGDPLGEVNFDVVAQAYDVAVGDPDVWILAEKIDRPESMLFRVDPETADVSDAFDLPGVSSLTLSFGHGSLWTSATPASKPEQPQPDAQLLRIDPATGEVVATVALKTHSPGHIAFGESNVMIIAGGSDDPQVITVDPATNEVAERFKIPGDLSVTDVAAAYGSLWVAGKDVYRLDATSGKVLASIKTDSPELLPPADPHFELVGCDLDKPHEKGFACTAEGKFTDRSTGESGYLVELKYDGGLGELLTNKLPTGGMPGVGSIYSRRQDVNPTFRFCATVWATLGGERSAPSERACSVVNRSGELVDAAPFAETE